jgi:hypothetical protein
MQPLGCLNVAQNGVDMQPLGCVCANPSPSGNWLGAAAVSDNMNAMTRTMLTLVLAASAVVLAIGCGIDVHEAERGKSVDIKSPLGDVSVRTDVKNPDTGLPVYPGAQPLREHGEHESANVNVDSRWFGVKVIAAKYESDDAQDRILEFYRREMKTYGTVTECRGDVDFRGGPGARRVVCKDRPSSDDVHLVTGTEDRQRVVAVKSRGTGSEFSLVYVNTRG